MSAFRVSATSITHNINDDVAFSDSISGSAGKTLTLTDIHLSSFANFYVILGAGVASQLFKCSVGPDNQVNLSGLAYGPTHTYGGADGDFTISLFSPDYGLLGGSYSGYSNYPALNFYIAGTLT